MSEDTLKKISGQLDQLIALVALNSIKGMKPTEAILTLGSVRLDRNLIAQITGSTPSTVSVRLSEAKAKAKEKPSGQKRSRKSAKQK
jgi:hypothetical protein